MLDSGLRILENKHPLRSPFGCAPSFAILLRQGYEGTSYGGQAGWREEISNIQPRLILLGQARNDEIQSERLRGRIYFIVKKGLI